MSYYLAQGNTYDAREALRACGFNFDAESKEWRAQKNDFKSNDWHTKYCSPTYIGRRLGNICRKITIVEVAK